MTLFGFWIGEHYLSLTFGINAGLGIFYVNRTAYWAICLGPLCLSMKYIEDEL